MSGPQSPIDTEPFQLEYPSSPLRWADAFAVDQPVELEVGSGKGLFLANTATASPAHNFVGIELSRKYALKVAERVAKRQLPNVKVVAGDARRFLHEFVPLASLVAVHIYFPDPWWKKRHKKRRVFCEEFVSDVARALRPQGDFWIATDVEEYFGVMQTLMMAHPEFRPMPSPEPTTPENDLDYLTNFERKYRLEGRAIYRAHYQLASIAPDDTVK
jgi:tRNA (guanine-N7-)-methyltransferase